MLGTGILANSLPRAIEIMDIWKSTTITLTKSIIPNTFSIFFFMPTDSVSLPIFRDFFLQQRETITEKKGKERMNKRKKPVINQNSDS